MGRVKMVDDFLLSGYEPSPSVVSEIKTPKELEAFKAALNELMKHKREEPE